MGVNVPLVKFIVVLASTMITVVSVSISGIIGWVGMVVPHIARIVVGSSYPKLSASSFLIGGIFPYFEALPLLCRPHLLQDRKSVV